MHSIQLSNGMLLAAYNHHKYKLRQRSNLFISTSADRGKTWQVVAKLEQKFAPLTMHHYPTLLQAGCKVYVVYSDHMHGIRIATLKLDFK
ncbi:hypothetical protein CYMTET_35418 [Cymbomonas tetramitiformis]|uniref:Sialidase domain-containing protein n=1 Tax=Cymbomonas tetramitiformis TaxID=36881 RepID=A0AAE0F9J4_9CHLO|nr:hypothetical protein CYMTET_35418 [Cymbomonas tetramitiformis]